MAISYTRTTWVDGQSGGTPVTADRLNNIEQGIVDCVDAFNGITPESLGALPLSALPINKQNGGTGVDATSLTSNTVFAAPASGNGEAAFRILSQSHIPELNASKITSGVLPVVRGGTGAGTAEDARIALGAASAEDMQIVEETLSTLALTWQAVDANASTATTTASGGHFSIDVVVNIPAGCIPLGIVRLTYQDYGVALGGYTITNVTETTVTVRAYFENVSGATLAAGKVVNVRMYFAKLSS